MMFRLSTIVLIYWTIANEVCTVVGSFVERPFYFLGESGMPVNSTRSFTKPNSRECELVCNGNSNCVAFGYNSRNLTCHLYHRFLTLQDLQPDKYNDCSIFSQEIELHVLIYQKSGDHGFECRWICPKFHQVESWYSKDYGVNIAAFKPVHSSPNTIGGAGLAVNQEIMPPCFRTGFGDYSPFLTVDLEDIYQIWMVILYNVPDDDYPERLHDVNIEVSYAANHWNTEAPDAVCCSSVHGLLTSGPTAVKCRVGVYGKHVRIFIEKSELMTICEVQIFGKKVTRPSSTCWKITPDPCKRLPGGKNVAFNKPATLSSKYDWRLEGNLTVDGNRDGRYYLSTCPATGSTDRTPWLLVDLENNYNITSFTISNRNDNGYDVRYRMQNVRVEVSNTDPRYEISTPSLCKFISGWFGQTIRTFRCDNVTIGRYVNVSKITKYLEVCEFEVTGKLIPDLL